MCEKIYFQFRYMMNYCRLYFSIAFFQEHLIGNELIPVKKRLYYDWPKMTLARACLGPLRPFGPFLHLESYKAENQAAESSKGRFEANSRKINFDPLCNIRPNRIFRPCDILSLLKIRPNFFSANRPDSKKTSFFLSVCDHENYRSKRSIDSKFGKKCIFY
jgi:hypothetical protein